MVQQSTPYALTGLGLVVGLMTLLFEPFSTPIVNHFVGGLFLAIATASVAYMIVAFSGPDERRPDF
ncbi:hypothetical protein [Halobellus marinus]|uniref:hypothetical protein n=1 Tax=Halobellus TaxID=1073986 RepID=UPI0028A9116A|nr:hypothetical protein [Halobellus sp. DFY28]